MQIRKTMRKRVQAGLKKLRHEKLAECRQNKSNRSKGQRAARIARLVRITKKRHGGQLTPSGLDYLLLKGVNMSDLSSEFEQVQA